MTQTRRIIPIIAQEKLVSPTNQPWSGLRTLPPLTLYIHVPWCIRKCPYCDFNSHEAAGGEIPEEEYLAALTKDLEMALPDIWGRHVHAVFLGGGTPSLLSAQAMDELLSMVRARIPLWADAEITIEANPGASEVSRFRAYAQSGVNRISLGIQSLEDEQLKALGRIHDSQQARAAIEAAVGSFSRVNLDLMYGLPGQTPEQWQHTLRQARDYGTEHLSLYQLTIEPQTVFAKYPPSLPDDDVMDELENIISEEVIQKGWQRYEVSAYAKSGAQCRHNLNYWTFGDYLGIGPGAHSKLSFPDRIVRQARTRNPEQWMQKLSKGDGSHISEQRVVSEAEIPFEFMLNALRLKEGVAVDVFEAHTGLTLHHIGTPRKKAIQKGLLSSDPTRIVATELGWRHLNDLQALFLPESD